MRSPLRVETAEEADLVYVPFYVSFANKQSRARKEVRPVSIHAFRVSHIGRVF